MANPRQRRKARSTHKPVHHSRQAKKLLKKQPRGLGFFVYMSALPTCIWFHTHQAIRGPKVLQEAWDKHKTVRQKYVYTVLDEECWITDGIFATVLFASYAALGLAASLNPNTSGGAECAAPVTDARSVVNGVDNLDPAVLMSGGGDRDLPIGLGRIVRDEAGRIIDVETNDDVDPPPSNHRLDLVEEVAAAAADRKSVV